MIVAVVRVVLCNAVQPLDVRASEPVAQCIDAAVPAPVVVIGSMFERPRLDRRVDRSGAVRPARLDESAGARAELPAGDLVEPDERNLARRSANARREPADDLLGDRDPRTLEVVDALAPVAPLVVRTRKLPEPPAVLGRSGITAVTPSTSSDRAIGTPRC